MDPLKVQDILSIISDSFSPKQQLGNAANIILVAQGIRTATMLSIGCNIPTPDFGDIPIELTRIVTRHYPKSDILWVHRPGYLPPDIQNNDVKIGEYLGYLSPRNLKTTTSTKSTFVLRWTCGDELGQWVDLWAEIIEDGNLAKSITILTAKLAAIQTALAPSGLVVKCSICNRLGAADARRAVE